MSTAGTRCNPCPALTLPALLRFLGCFPRNSRDSRSFVRSHHSETRLTTMNPSSARRFAAALLVGLLPSLPALPATACTTARPNNAMPRPAAPPMPPAIRPSRRFLPSRSASGWRFCLPRGLQAWRHAAFCLPAFPCAREGGTARARRADPQGSGGCRLRSRTGRICVDRQRHRTCPRGQPADQDGTAALISGSARPPAPRYQSARSRRPADRTGRAQPDASRRSSRVPKWWE